MKKRAPRTVMEVCAARGGVWKGSKVASFICQWTMASQSMGKAITLTEYAEWWCQSEATAYRHQAEFRALFPGMTTPQPIADEAIARGEEWLSRGLAGFGRLPAEVVLA